MGEPVLLIVAKAPVPGLCKTRIAESVGDRNAALLSAAALLDTLDTAKRTTLPVTVAMTGDRDAAVDRDALYASLHGVRIIEQRGKTFAERLTHAHTDADTGNGIVQVGMDTPQIAVDDYVEASRLVRDGETVLGPADDGGWWLLGVPDVTQSRVLLDVPMSTARTCDDTAAAFGRVSWVRTLCDMDTWAEAVALARQLPESRLASVTSDLAGVVHD